ncbi:MAG: hypothetical protein LBR58_04875 [Propionibacteriaceae bacterium]|jgi:hypothetical protein|nr:hypothetical protein [Propionibacteriaceae bacterium]
MKSLRRWQVAAVALALGVGGLFGCGSGQGTVATGEPNDTGSNTVEPAVPQEASPASWHQLEVPFEPSGDRAAAVWLGAGEYLVFGVGGDANQAYRFSLADMSWRRMADMPTPYWTSRVQQHAVVSGGSVWVKIRQDRIDGEGEGNTRLVRYDIAADSWEMVRDCDDLDGMSLLGTRQTVAVRHCSYDDQRTVDYLVNGDWRQAQADAEKETMGVGNLLIQYGVDDNRVCHYNALDLATGAWSDRRNLNEATGDLLGYPVCEGATTTAGDALLVGSSDALISILDPVSSEAKDIPIRWDAAGPVGDNVMLRDDYANWQSHYWAVDLDTGHAWRLPEVIDWADGCEEPVLGTLDGTGYALLSSNGDHIRWWLATFG